MKNDQKILGIAAAAGLPLAAAYGLTAYILRVATDREPPGSYQRISTILEGQTGGDNPYAALEPGREKLKNTPHETVEIRAHDGTQLVGHWFAQDDPQRVILAAHGWRSAWYRDFGAVADFWRDNSCSVLYIEQRGQGNSGGAKIGFGLTEYLDIPDWLSWIRERCGDAVPVYLAGISMGATTVLLAADLNLPGNVKGIMADCGFTSPDAIFCHVARRNLHLPYVLTKRFADLLFAKQIGVRPDSRSTIDALKRSKYPILLFHGEADGFVPVNMTYENYAACASPKQLMIVSGAIHGMSYVVRQAEYEAKEKQFWVDLEEERNGT